MSKYSYTDEEFIKAVQNSVSIAEVCRHIGIVDKGGSYRVVHNKINKLGLDISHFTGKAWNQGKRYRQILQPKSLEEILVENSYYQSHKLKERLIKEGLKEYKCERCKRTEWENEKIPLELHHINGNNTDNRLENLQLLCPNCHALTDNYRAKNKESVKNKIKKELKPKVVEELTEEDLRIHSEARLLAKRKSIKIAEAEELIKNSPNKSIEDFPKLKSGYNHLEDKVCPICRKTFHPKNKEQIYCSYECVHKSQSKIPEKEDLLKSIIEFNATFTKIGEKYGVSDKAVTKWCIKYGFPSHKKDLLEYINKIK